MHSLESLISYKDKIVELIKHGGSAWVVQGLDSENTKQMFNKWNSMMEHLGSSNEQSEESINCKLWSEEGVVSDN